MLLEKLIIKSKPYLLNQKTIRISYEGRFEFSRLAIKELKLKDGVKIDFFHDKDDNKSWFIHIDDEGQSPVRIGKDKKCRIISKELRKKVLSPLQLSNSMSVKFEIKDEIILEGKRFYPIELIKALNKVTIFQ